MGTPFRRSRSIIRRMVRPSRLVSVWSCRSGTAFDCPQGRNSEIFTGFTKPFSALSVQLIQEQLIVDQKPIAWINTRKPSLLFHQPEPMLWLRTAFRRLANCQHVNGLHYFHLPSPKCHPRRSRNNCITFRVRHRIQLHRLHNIVLSRWFLKYLFFETLRWFCSCVRPSVSIICC